MTTKISDRVTRLATLGCAAAAALPAADAAIIYDSSPSVKVGFSSGFGTTWTLDLPGTVDLQLQRLKASPWTYTAQVKGPGVGYLRVRSFLTAARPFAKRGSAGNTWSNIGGNIGTRGIVGVRTTTSNIRGPGSFSDKFVAFKFQDSTQGNADRYGWLQLSMDIHGWPAGPPFTGPDVTLKGWGYDNSGAKIAMGAVPEPASAAAVTGAALVLGAAGVRAWRKRRTQPTQD
jgi:hypothetical protein